MSYRAGPCLEPCGGPSVLTFGIPSLVVRFWFGVFAWTRANPHLARMRAGRTNAPKSR